MEKPAILWQADVEAFMDLIKMHSLFSPIGRIHFPLTFLLSTWVAVASRLPHLCLLHCPIILAVKISGKWEETERNLRDMGAERRPLVLISAVFSILSPAGFQVLLWPTQLPFCSESPTLVTFHCFKISLTTTTTRINSKIGGGCSMWPNCTEALYSLPQLILTV